MADVMAECSASWLAGGVAGWLSNWVEGWKGGEFVLVYGIFNAFYPYVFPLDCMLRELRVEEASLFSYFLVFIYIIYEVFCPHVRLPHDYMFGSV